MKNQQKYTEADLKYLTAPTAKKWANRLGILKGPISKDPNPAPLCKCGQPRVVTLNHHWGGVPTYDPRCRQCHDNRILTKNNASSLIEVTAKKAGFKSATEFRHSIHPYLHHRKKYCENIDGRLGKTCTTSIFWEGMLDVDHIDGNPSNNNESNLQTLCKCCHSYKTYISKDYRTPGRKALGLKY